tara:strand:- start:2659 stop:2856 length:198 start_codon:yes stop_codon:yes gene_type:complete
MPKLRSSARRSYASRRKHSHCQGILTAQCRHRKGCRMAFGKKRTFCRKTKNRRRTVRRRSSRRTH